MSQRKSILVFHRNVMFRDCLVRFLAKDGEYDAKGIDHSKSDELDALLKLTADMLILDLGLPDRMAIDITRAIKDSQLETRVLILVPEQRESLVECISEGAHGCILECSSLEDLEQALESVWAGDIYCCPDVMGTVFSELARFSGMKAPRSKTIPKERRLTAREQEILLLLDKRMSNKEIASTLCVSLFTVKNHVRNILEKLNVDSRIDAPEVARRDYDLSPRSSGIRAR